MVVYIRDKGNNLSVRLIIRALHGMLISDVAPIISLVESETRHPHLITKVLWYLLFTCICVYASRFCAKT